uniref:C1q domain-containing protein n=1 Tax=Magallana gigas TaxID=29159 RepID=A0A8W8JBI5_MAGGI
MQIKKPGSVIRESLVQTDHQNDKDRTAKHDAHNQSGIPKQRLLFPTTQQPVTTPTIIAFYAYMATDTPSITIQHPLVFDVVKTNNGNGYHPSTGTFIAPETGIYVFTWTIRETGNCFHSTQLMVNTSEIGIIYVHVGSGGDLAGTGVVVTHVNAGDDVYVRTYANWNDCYIYSNKAGRSSFAGWKLS